MRKLLHFVNHHPDPGLRLDALVTLLRHLVVAAGLDTTVSLWQALSDDLLLQVMRPLQVVASARARIQASRTFATAYPILHQWVSARDQRQWVELTAVQHSHY